MSAKSWQRIIQEAPDDWNRGKFGDFFRKREERGGDDLPLVSVTGDRGIVFRDELERRDTSNADKSKYLNVYPGDIVYNTMRMWQGVSARSSLRGLTSPAYTVCQPRDQIASEYAAYLLKLPVLVREFHSRSQGIVDDTLSLKFPAFSAIPTVIPPLPEQRRIAEILSSVDEAISATQAVIDQTRTVKQGVLKRLLTKGIGHHRFKQTEIGEVPEAWGVVTADELCDRISVGIVVQPAQYYVPEGVKCFRSANVREGFVEDTNWVYITPETNKQLAKSRLQTGDVLVVRSGYTGTSCVVTPEYDGTNCIDIIFARPKQDRVNPHFLSALINSPVGREQVLRYEGGMAQKHFNVSAMKKMLVPLPDAAEQNSIAERIVDLDKQERLFEREFDRLLKIKAALMSDLLTGRKRVPELVQAAAE